MKHYLKKELPVSFADIKKVVEKGIANFFIFESAGLKCSNLPDLIKYNGYIRMSNTFNPNKIPWLNAEGESVTVDLPVWGRGVEKTPIIIRDIEEVIYNFKSYRGKLRTNIQVTENNIKRMQEQYDHDSAAERIRNPHGMFQAPYMLQLLVDITQMKKELPLLKSMLLQLERGYADTPGPQVIPSEPVVRRGLSKTKKDFIWKKVMEELYIPRYNAIATGNSARDVTVVDNIISSILEECRTRIEAKKRESDNIKSAKAAENASRDSAISRFVSRNKKPSTFSEKYKFGDSAMGGRRHTLKKRNHKKLSKISRKITR